MSGTILMTSLRQRQEEEQEDEDYDNDNEGGRQPQQEVKEDVAAALMTEKIGNIYLAKRMKNLGLPTTIHLQSQDKTSWGAMGIIVATTNLTTLSSRTRMMGDHVLLNGSENDHPHPTTAQCTRSASIILSRGLSANKDHAQSLIGVL